jgi:hypothetical protein
MPPMDEPSFTALATIAPQAGLAVQIASLRASTARLVALYGAHKQLAAELLHRVSRTDLDQGLAVLAEVIFDKAVGVAADLDDLERSVSC